MNILHATATALCN